MITTSDRRFSMRDIICFISTAEKFLHIALTIYLVLDYINHLDEICCICFLDRSTI